MNREKEANQPEFEADVGQTDGVNAETKPTESTQADVGQTDGVNAAPQIGTTESGKAKFPWKKALFYTLFAIICATSIAITGYMDFSEGTIMPFSQIMKMLARNWYYLVFALISLAMVFVCEGLRTSLLLYGVSKKFRFRLGISTAALTKCYDYITPLGAGGQPFAIVYMNKKGVEGGTASAVVLSSYFLQQVIYVLLAVVSLAFISYVNISPSQTIMAIIGSVTCFLVPFAIITFALLPKATSKVVTGFIRFLAKIRLVKNPDKIIEKAIGGVSKNAEGLKNLACNKTIFILSILCSIGGWCAQCSIAYFTLRSFGFDLPENGFAEWLQIVQMCLILYISVSFIPTPGNAGASELSFYFIFTENLAAGVGFTALIFWRLLSYYSFIVIGLLVDIRRNVEKKKRQKIAT